MSAEDSMTSLPSRKDRRKPDEVNAATGKKWLLPVVAVGSLVVGVASGLLLSGTSPNSGSVSAVTNGVTTNLAYAPMEFPEGWNGEKAELDVGTQTSARNPATAFSGSCIYSRMTTYLDAGVESRGAEYLTKNLLYSYADRANVESVDVVDTEITVGDKDTYAASARWDNTYVVTRVFDGVSGEVPEDIKDAPPYELATVTDTGVPAVVMVYECGSDDDFSAEQAEQFVADTTIIPTSDNK